MGRGRQATAKSVNRFLVAKYEIYTGVRIKNQNFRDFSVNWQIPTYHNVLSASPE